MCRLVSGARATWQKQQKLSDLYVLLMEEFPTMQNLFLSSHAFTTYVKEYKKLNWNYLPQVTVDYRLIELKDGVYNFADGELDPSSSEKWKYTSCASTWMNHIFHELT